MLLSVVVLSKNFYAHVLTTMTMILYELRMVPVVTTRAGYWTHPQPTTSMGPIPCSSSMVLDPFLLWLRCAHTDIPRMGGVQYLHVPTLPHCATITVWYQVIPRRCGYHTFHAWACSISAYQHYHRRVRSLFHAHTSFVSPSTRPLIQTSVGAQPAICIPQNSTFSELPSL